jgi:beta-1,4-mannosyltransferase
VRILILAQGQSELTAIESLVLAGGQRKHHMKVAFIYVWRENRYHVELEKSLRALGVDVLCPQLKTLYTHVFAGAEKVDVVHIHALPYFNWSNIPRYILFYLRLSRLQKRGVRLVLTVHDFQNHDSRNWPIEHLVGGYFARRLDALIVHGQTAKKIVETRWRGCSSNQISVIPHGHYIQSYKNCIGAEVARVSLGLEPSNLVFLFVGLIRPYKGLSEMIEVFKGCAHPGARLVIAGKLASDEIGNKIALAVQGDSRITFVPGYVHDDEIQRYMNACDVVVLPYKRVFTSGAAVLAMSFGKPCIAPRLGCVPDMLDEEGAVFFDPAVDGDLERAFQKVIACRERLAGMGRYNLERASGWNWDGIGRATAALYEQCVAAEKK